MARFAGPLLTPSGYLLTARVQPQASPTPTSRELEQLRQRAEMAEAGLQVQVHDIMGSCWYGADEGCSVQEKFVSKQERAIDEHRQSMTELEAKLAKAEKEAESARQDAELSAMGLSQLGTTMAEDRQKNEAKIKELEEQVVASQSGQIQEAQEQV